MKTVFRLAFNRTYQTIAEALFPMECLGCSSAEAFLCAACCRQCFTLPILTCPICSEKSPVGATHPKCQSPHNIDGIFAAGSFKDYVLRQAIKKYKYRNTRILADSLAYLLAEKIKKNFFHLIGTQDFILTPVPLYSINEKRRGFNQSQLLARSLSEKLSLRYLDTLLREKYTKDQTRLDRQERLENVMRAFAVTNQEIRNLNFLLIDDVTTTGATLKECAKVLKRNGAKIVWGMAVAKD